MRTQETTNGDYIVHDTPILHWCVVATLVFCSGAAFIQNAPSWMLYSLGFLIVVMLARNSSFTITTRFSPSELKIRTEHKGLFGVKRREIKFNAVKKVDFAIERWGRRRKTPRANLTLWTLDEDIRSDPFEIFVMANPHQAKQVANRIFEMLKPFLPPELPETAPIPSWFDNDASSYLYDLCRKHSSETCFFVALEDLDKSRRSVMETDLSLPKDEKIIAFHDLTNDKSAKRGIAVGSGGLYWANSF